MLQKTKLMEKKWFFIEEVRITGSLYFNAAYPLFCLKEELSKKIKKETKNYFSRLFTRNIYELDSSGKKIKLKKTLF